MEAYIGLGIVLFEFLAIKYGIWIAGTKGYWDQDTCVIWSLIITLVAICAVIWLATLPEQVKYLKQKQTKKVKSNNRHRKD